MATAAKIETTDIVIANDSAQVVLFERDKFDAFYAKLKADVDAVPVDLKTDKGRKAIASAAAKVRTEKASIDRDRKRLTQEWRDMTAQVNGAWKVIEAQLDDLAVEARKPLTEWEKAEKERIDGCNSTISELVSAGVVTLDDTTATVRTRGEQVWGTEIDPARFGDLTDKAQDAKDHAVASLKAALARLTREEEERAELEKLRAEAAERDRIEAERLAAEEVARRAAEDKQRQQDEAREREDARIAAEKADAERIERAQQEAAEAARREAEKAKQAEVDAANERAAKAERDAQRQRDEAAQAERERIAQAEAEAAEQAKRDKNRAHRAQIMGEAKIAIMAAGSVDEAAAVAIVKAIVNSSIPHVTLRF